MKLETEDDVSITLTSFFMKFAGFWMASNRTEQRYRIITLTYTVYNVLLGVWLMVADFYHSWGNVGTVLYVSCNLLSATIVVIKLTVMLTHKGEIIDLIEYMRNHFWNDNYDYYEKVILIDSKKKCTFFIITVILSAHCAIISYLATPIAENIGRNESDRVLPFNIWIGLPMSRTPYYEIGFGIELIALYQVGVCYISFDNILCIISIHVSGQFRILQYRLAKLCNLEETKDQNGNTDLVYYTDKCYTRLKSYIRQHQNLIDYCVRLENVFTTITLGQVVVFSMLICLYGYQILLADASFGRRCVFIFLMLCSTSMLFMFTYSCHVIMEQSGMISLAAFSGPWMHMPMNKTGKMLRRDLIMLMLRSQRVCCLTANGFFPVSLETYTTILSTAMSYFTLLSQNSDKAIGS